MQLFPIETGNLKLDGGAMFGVVPKVLWNKAYPADENNLCNWSMRCLLVIDGDRKILIDNGIGEKQDEKWLKNYYLNGDDTLGKSLAKAGFSFELEDNTHPTPFSQKACPSRSPTLQGSYRLHWF